MQAEDAGGTGASRPGPRLPRRDPRSASPPRAMAGAACTIDGVPAPRRSRDILVPHDRRHTTRCGWRRPAGSGGRADRCQVRALPATMNRESGSPDTGACRRARASDKHGVAPSRIRPLDTGLPAGRFGVRIRQRSPRSRPGGPTAATARSACASGSAFALSLVSDRGGQPTPVSAAAWFARHGGVAGIPARGWRQASRQGRDATVRSGPVTLHAVQGPDRTWQVDSGSWCS